MCYIFLEAMAHLVSFTYELWLFSIATFGKRHNKSPIWYGLYHPVNIGRDHYCAYHIGYTY
jgi:hypothetical protein